MFGMGFTEILIILVIAILFLGPEKLPTAMVDIAKFFRQMKSTVGNMKETLEEEMNVSEIKKEALSYKEKLLDAQDEFEKITSIPDVDSTLTNISDNIIDSVEKSTEIKEVKVVKEETVTFKKKKKIEEENVDV